MNTDTQTHTQQINQQRSWGEGGGGTRYSKDRFSEDRYSEDHYSDAQLPVYTERVRG